MSVPGEQWRPLRALLGGQIEVAAELTVSELALDSRDLRPGAAFLACAGVRHHGLEFLPQALAAGARVILWEPAAGVSAPRVPAEVVALAVPALRSQAGYIADRFYGAPTSSLTVAGITGTNGKTTVAWLLAQALERCGRSAAYIGTLGSGRPGQLTPATHTTPDPVRLQRELARLRDAGVQAVAMEVSSHALDQERCAGVRFHTAAFTNLSRDHLDYHGSMAAYAEAKAKLFAWPTLSARVINVDDEFGRQLANRERPGTDLYLTSRTTRPAVASPAHSVHAQAWRLDDQGLGLEIRTAAERVQLHSALIGEFNLDNLLTTFAVLQAQGVPAADAARALAQCEAAPGRMQFDGGGALPLVIVDYAHTPDALQKALAAARAHCRGRLWSVFGCGGERDAGKRALMGQVAAANADSVILTDDNPRGEDPETIIAGILAGIPARERVTVIHDREQAIRAALAQARSGDVVLVAGKGHEDYQLVGTQRRAFSDAATVHAALASRSAA
ncbi:MAG TPA: UDP-N-acetylmuramoyl-L-alanyl-D-glutamate--2,6-diaminopimelate ligase [Steroidobacteraceae bacterium]|nr:UDP-N-acetylmuramoyl-L-alanyl-D-glutamate--2,6-diaminopimelate ligase [Steroidobacteraceae bacterium]